MQPGERRRVLMHRAGALFTVAPGQRRFIQELDKANTGAFELVLTPLVFALIGFFVDNALNTGRFFTFGLGLVGFAGAVLRIYFDYTARMKKAEEGKPWTRGRS